MSLDPVRAAATERAAATDRLRTLVQQAVADELGTVEDIATAAGVSRPTVYRWAKGQIDERGVGPLMDAALATMIEAGAGGADELFKGLRHSDLSVKARRVQLGTKNLPAGALTPEQRRTVGDGADAAQRYLAYLRAR